MIIEKSYNVPSGNLKFVFEYNESISGELEPFDIIEIGDFKSGYDDEGDIEIAVYPSNIEIVMDDYISGNYDKLKLLLKAYSKTYPYNHLEVFTLRIIHNSETKFVGFLDELESDNENWNISLTFIDRINNLKNVSIANPYILKKLKSNNVIQGKGDEHNCAYGFRDFTFYTVNNEKKGWAVNWVEYGDGEAKLLKALETLFKTIGDDVEIDFQNEFLFREPGAPYAEITDLYIRRVCSYLTGRFVALKKAPDAMPVIYYPEGYPEYSKPEYFQKVFEDEDYIVYYHTWYGYLGSVFWYTGVGIMNVSDLLKILAKNFFSYFGFKGSHHVYFRHKRFTSNPTPLSEIISMSKYVSANKILGVKIDDQYKSDVYTTYGETFDSASEGVISYKIPLNSFLTDISFEYRLFYFVGGVRKLVKFFKDRQQGYEGTAQEVIARAEYESQKDQRDKYELTLPGVNYPYDSTYSVDTFNYIGSFRPLEIAINYFDDITIMKTIEV